MFVEDTHKKQRIVKNLDYEFSNFGFGNFDDKYRDHPYFQLLKDVAAKLRDPDRAYTKEMKQYGCEFGEIISGKSKIHPFLEIGGAVRTQVPLPKNTLELKILTDVILYLYLVNNENRYRFPDKGFTAEQLPENSFVRPIGGGVSILVWLDACDASNEKELDYNQSLATLITSVIYQTADINSYGKRGRYGAATVRRLIDGHAYAPNLSTPKSLTISAFAFCTKTGLPFALYHGVVFPKSFSFSTEDGALGKADVGAPTVQLNYTFNQGAPATVQGGGIHKYTDMMTAAILEQASYLLAVDIKDFYLTIHTDKCAAAKSVEKYLNVAERKKENYYTIACKVWGDITYNRLEKFRSPLTSEQWPSLFFVDPSTVDKGDPAEEVPSQGDRFYRAVYPSYRQLVRKRTGVALPEKIINGKLKEDEIFNFFGGQEELSARLINNLQLENSLKVMMGSRTVFEGAVMDPKGYFNENWRMNYRFSFQDLQINWSDYGITTERRKAELGRLLNNQCKTGNSANEDQFLVDGFGNLNAQVPRMTDFAYIMVGNIQWWDRKNSDQPSPIAKAITEMIRLSGREVTLRSRM